jgi:hypothetical protein
MTRLFSILLASLAVPALCISQAERKSPAKIALSNLTFISGRWQGNMEGGIAEEQWSVPAGDSMMGMFRHVKGGKAVFYELMLIEQSPDGPVLKLKHFNPGLIGWEEKAEVLQFSVGEV